MFLTGERVSARARAPGQGCCGGENKVLKRHSPLVGQHGLSNCIMPRASLTTALLCEPGVC